MEITPTIAISIVAIIIAFAGFLRSVVRDSKQDWAALDNRLQAVERNQAVWVDRVDVLWKSVKVGFVTDIHQPHPEQARCDELLERYEAESISFKELEELMVLLYRAMDSENLKDKKAALKGLVQMIEGDLKFQREIDRAHAG